MSSKTLKIPRIYTGKDGQSHWDEIEIEFNPSSEYGGLVERTAKQGVSAISFRYAPANTFVDFHPAPARQYVVTLTGEVEYGTGDGTKRRFGPGGIFLAADTTGQGHTSQGIGSTPRLSAYIPVVD